MAIRGRLSLTERALTQRINRALAGREQVLKRARDHMRRELGEYYLIDLRRNVVAAKRVDIEALGEELGALRAYERLDKGRSAFAAKLTRVLSRGSRKRRR